MWGLPKVHNCATLIVAAALAACGSHSDLSQQSQSLPTSTTPKRVLFVSNQDGDREIYLIGADGSGLQQLTHNDRDDYEASWSPDGQSILFTSNRDKGNAEIYRMRADGSQPVNLSGWKGFDGQPTWSPDGRSIAFVSDRTGSLDIFVMDAGGGNPVRVTNDMSSSHDSPGWSPDSQWLAYRKLNKDAKGDTWLVRLADGQHRQVTNNPKHEDSKVQWSPDGRSLLYDSRRNKEFNIYRFDLQTDQEHKLTDLPSSDIGPIWSSDGALISFLSTRGPHGRTQLYLMKEDGSDQHSITDGVNQVDDPVWLDENSMLMVSWRGNRFSNLYLVDLKTRTWRPLAPVDGYQSQPLPEPVLLPGTDRGGNHQESANVWK